MRDAEARGLREKEALERSMGAEIEELQAALRVGQGDACAGGGAGWAAVQQ